MNRTNKTEDLKITEDPLSVNGSVSVMDKSMDSRVGKRMDVKCTFCPKAFHSLKDLIQHFTVTLGHPKPRSVRKFKKVENKFQCSTCEKLCESLQDFSNHVCIQNQHQEPKAKFHKLETITETKSEDEKETPSSSFSKSKRAAVESKLLEIISGLLNSKNPYIIKVWSGVGPL